MSRFMNRFTITSCKQCPASHINNERGRLMCYSLLEKHNKGELDEGVSCFLESNWKIAVPDKCPKMIVADTAE